MKMIPAVRTAQVAVVPAVVHHLQVEAVVPALVRVPQVVAVRVLPEAHRAVPVAVLRHLQVPRTDRICRVAAVFSAYPMANWFCIRSAVVKMTMMTHPMTILLRMILQAPTVPAVAVLTARHLQVAAVVVPVLDRVLQAVAVLRAVAAAPQVRPLLRNQVHRTMILQVPVIPVMMTVMN